MLSDRFYWLLHLTLYLYSYFGFTPFRFDIATKLLTPYPRTRPLIWIHMLTWLAWVIFVLLQSICFYRNHDLNNFNLNVTCTIAAFLGLEFFMIFTFLEKQMFTFINSTLLFVRRINRKLPTVSKFFAMKYF